MCDCNISNFNNLSLISANCVGFVRMIVIFKVTSEVNSPRISLTEIIVLSVILSKDNGFQFFMIIEPVGERIGYYMFKSFLYSLYKIYNKLTSCSIRDIGRVPESLQSYGHNITKRSHSWNDHVAVRLNVWSSTPRTTSVMSEGSLNGWHRLHYTM